MLSIAVFNWCIFAMYCHNQRSFCPRPHFISITLITTETCPSLEVLYWEWFVQIRAVDSGSLIGRARDMMGQRRGWFQLSRVQIPGLESSSAAWSVLPILTSNHVYSRVVLDAEGSHNHDSCDRKIIKMKDRNRHGRGTDQHYVHLLSGLGVSMRQHRCDWPPTPF